MVAGMHVQTLFDLTGRAAVVTGGGTHLGRAMAEALGELGAAVYLASRDGARCERVAAELRASGLDATGLGADVTVDMTRSTAAKERPRCASMGAST